ncbi:MAG: lysine biosynthesis protein LysW [Chloroflexota bacterium]|jgi:alpha-aminoadipate carrier protein LysW
MMATCPECEGALTLGGDVQAGEIVVCSDCGVDLEVINLAPLSLSLAPQEAEDWGE